MLAPKEIGGGIEAVSKSAQGAINTENPEAHSLMKVPKDGLMNNTKRQGLY